MASLLEDCFPERQRSVNRLLVVKGLKPNEIISRILIQYRNSCINHANVHKWIDSFKSSRTSVSDETWSGRSVEVSGCSLESRIDGLICENKRITVEMISEKLE